jgi:hypothetical protein
VTVLEQVRAFFEAHPSGVVAAWIFGSQARGTARPDSDVDVAVLLPARPPPTLEAQLYDVEDALTGWLGRPAQLVIVNSAPPDLVHRVLRDGKLVIDRDRSARIRFEVAARNAYWDLKPHLDRYRRIA